MSNTLVKISSQTDIDNPISPLEPNEHGNEQQALRDDVLAEIKRAGLSQTAAANEAGVHPSALSPWLKGKYTGDNNKLAADLRKWLAHRHRKMQSDMHLPKAPAFFETPTTNHILSALSYAQLASDLVVIYGGAGVGKSTAITRYADCSPSVWVMESTPTSGTVGGFLRRLAYSLGQRNISGHAEALEMAIRERLSGTDGLLIIDEAQFLNERALEAARRIAELCNVGLALVGNETVYTQLTGRHRGANFAQLFSRIGKRVRLTQSSADDVKALLQAWGVDGTRERALLVDIAKRPGALRGVTKTLRLAAMFATGKSEPVDIHHIRAAWRDLGGAA